MFAPSFFSRKISVYLHQKRWPLNLGVNLHLVFTVGHGSCSVMEIFHVFLSFKINFFENSFRNTPRVPNCLDPDQARRSVGPGLVPNCLQKISVCLLASHLVLKPEDWFSRDVSYIKMHMHF